MNKASKEKLTVYVNHTNKSLVHPNDEEMFIDFIKTSHSMNDDEIETLEELEDILRSDKGFPEYRVERLLHNYEFGRQLLR